MAGILARMTRDRTPAVARVPYSPRTLAGPIITPDTVVTMPTAWACLRYLSQTTAVLPWRVMRPSAKGGVHAPENPADWLIGKRPSPEWSSFQFRETLLHWALRWGNGYAEIERDIYGRPLALWPLHPERVDVCRDPDTGALYYEVRNGSGGTVDVDAGNMFHVRGFGEGPVGVNVVAYAAQSLGWAKAAQMFGASFFGEGMNVSGVVTVKRKLDPTGFDRLKDELRQLYRGPRGERTAILENDMQWTAVGIEPDKAQFIATQQHLVEETCRWFGVPPHKVMHLLRSTFNNIEHQAIEVVVDSIAPWAKRFEDEADYKLFGMQRTRGFYTKMNMNALLRGDMKARMEFYKGMRDTGAFSPNRILELEEEPTIGEAGDIHVMQSQYAPLELIADGSALAAGKQSQDDDGEDEADAGDDGEDPADAAEASAIADRLITCLLEGVDG